MKRGGFGFSVIVVALLLMSMLPGFAKGEKSMKTSVHRENGKVWLEGVEGWFPWEKGSSVHAAQEAVMKAVGEDTTYAYQLGASSVAFRLQISKEGLCPSSPHPYCGYQCVKNSVEALPWNTVFYGVSPEDAAKVAEARRAVVESIDRGVPVEYGSEENGLILGYQKNGAEWTCIHYFHDSAMQERFTETNWPWGIMVYTSPKTSRTSKRRIAINSLEQVLKMADAEVFDGYYQGSTAWKMYIEKLKALDFADEQTVANNMHGNAWIYECLVHYRIAGVKYLREIAGLFDSDQAEHLRKAADIYEKQATEVLTDKTHPTIEVAPYPFSLKPGEKWESSTRNEQIKRLSKAMKLEQEAITQIRESKLDW